MRLVCFSRKNRAVLALCLLTQIIRAQPALRIPLDSLIQTFIKPDEPGGSVIISKGDSLLYSAGFGLADLNTREKITEHTVFNTGSVSKTFVSNAILLLQERKQLSVEDPLIKYFPGFKNTGIGSKVKIKHLLSHVSGLPDCRKVAENEKFYLTANDEQNFAPLLQTDTLVFEPGTRFQYSNPAYNGLALIIEKVTGRKWQHFVKTEIFAKAGMNESRITDGPEPSTGVAHAYEPGGKNRFKEADYGEVPTFCAAGNGGIWCSVNDLYHYYKALQQSSFLNPTLLDSSMRIKYFPEWNSTQPPSIGYSWFISYGNDRLLRIGHTGSQGGFTANFEMLPQQKIFIGMLFNKPVPVAKVMGQVEEILKKAGYYTPVP
jgi:CubicO group peptidase (beta-lactamase class C family)